MSTVRIRSRVPGFRASKRGQSKRKKGNMLRKDLNRYQATQIPQLPVSVMVKEVLCWEGNLKR